MLRLTLSAFTLMALASVALAQASRPAPSWLMSAQVYLADENLQKDLRLSAAQKLKANDLARSTGARLVERITDAKKADAIDRAVKKDLDDFLKPIQLARLRQVILQHLAKTLAGSAALAADEELVKQLKLDAPQKKKLQAGEVLLLDVLRQDQKKVWTDQVGKPFVTRLQTVLGSPSRVFEGPLALQYLSSKYVQADLKLNRQQLGEIDDLKRNYQKSLARNLDVRARQELLTAGEKAARDLLSQEQAKRLDQIDLQVSTRSREDALLKDERVAPKLKLTKAQQTMIAETFHKRREEMLSLFAADGTPDDIRDKVIAFKAQTRKRLEAVLDEKQRRTLRETVGEPFMASVRVRRVNPSAGAIGGTQHLYLTGAFYLGAPDLHKELKADAALARKLTALAEKYRSEGMLVILSGDETTRQQTAEANRKAITALLSEEQVGRFEQVVLNFLYSGSIRQQTRRRVHLYAEVRQGLKLTGEQIKQLDGGADLGTVLDESQAKLWKRMLGAAFAGSLLPQGGFFNARPAPPLDLLAVRTPAVVKELNLSDQQRKKIEKVHSDWRATAEKRPQQPGEGYAKYVHALDVQTEKAIAKILDGKQNARLRQVVLQDARKRGDALAYPWLAEALKISADQQKRIRSIQNDGAEVETLLATEYNSSPREPRPAGFEKTRQAIRKNAAKRSEAILGDEQKDLLKDLLGAPFAGEIERARHE